jgi:hypothetical protein
MPMKAVCTIHTEHHHLRTLLISIHRGVWAALLVFSASLAALYDIIVPADDAEPDGWS